MVFMCGQYLEVTSLMEKLLFQANMYVMGVLARDYKKDKNGSSTAEDLYFINTYV